MERGFITLNEFSTQELTDLIDLGLRIKKEPDYYSRKLTGKKLGMIFEQNSTRTRISFEVAMHDMGGTAFYYGPNQLQLARGEAISDTARVLSRYLDGILIRTLRHEHVWELRKFSSIPVINGLTREEHPCQALADMLTLKEHYKSLSGLKLCFVGDPNNVAFSLLQACVKLGVQMSLVSPLGYTFKQERLESLKNEEGLKKSPPLFTHDVEEGLAEADVVYTDVWTSMGFENETSERRQAFHSLAITPRMMAFAKSTAIFMHPLPAHREMEVLSQVLDSSQSIIFDQAENRLHIQKAILLTLFQEASSHVSLR